MSEEKKSFMAELDAWTEAEVIAPLHKVVTEGDSADCDAVGEEVKKAIRAKVLESYRNGQKKPAEAQALRPSAPKGARTWR